MTIEPTNHYDERATAALLNVSQRTLQRHRQEGGGMPYVRLGVRRIAYRGRDILAWTESRTFANRAAELDSAAQVRT